MADEWVTLPLDSLVTSTELNDGLVSKRCLLDSTRTVPAAVDTAIGQILTHFQRAHGAIEGSEVGQLPRAARNALVALGWTPPPDLSPGDPSPGSTDRPAPRRPRRRI